MIHKYAIRCLAGGPYMLAAASSDEKRILELFDLALRLVRQSGPIPEELSKHFNAILNQARALADNPDDVKGEISPEAIQLALKLKSIRNLRKAVDDIPNLSS